MLGTETVRETLSFSARTRLSAVASPLEIRTLVDHVLRVCVRTCECVCVCVCVFALRVFESVCECSLSVCVCGSVWTCATSRIRMWGTRMRAGASPEGSANDLPSVRVLVRVCECVCV